MSSVCPSPRDQFGFKSMKSPRIMLRKRRIPIVNSCSTNGIRNFDKNSRELEKQVSTKIAAAIAMKAKRHAYTQKHSAVEYPCDTAEPLAFDDRRMVKGSQAFTAHGYHIGYSTAHDPEGLPREYLPSPYYLKLAVLNDPLRLAVPGWLLWGPLRPNTHSQSGPR